MSRASQKTRGICHLCGLDGELTFEHIPPQRAFNNYRNVAVKFEDAIKLGPDFQPRGPIIQGGIGAYTLCARCNNLTGAWYAPRFIDWCYQGMEVLRLTNGKPSLISLHYMFPLAIIKQIVTMFASVNSPAFGRKNPELAAFVLNRERKYLPDAYKFYMFYNLSNRFRYLGLLAQGQVRQSRVKLFAEITYPPFGYVMTVDSDPPDRRLVDITDFASYDYSRFTVGEIWLPSLSVSTDVPGDYRSRTEVAKDMAEHAAKPAVQNVLTDNETNDWRESIKEATERINRSR